MRPTDSEGLRRNARRDRTLVGPRAPLRLAVVVLTLLSACLPAVKADVSVRDIERAFPVFSELGVRSYEFARFNAGEPVCEALEYRRGAFATINDGLCGAYDGDAVRTRMPFDAGAIADLATLKSALSGNGLDLLRIRIIQNPDGSVGSGSYFSADGCVTYNYVRGWSGLPPSVLGKELSTGIDPNWYRTDTCP